jgi:hypothetical protein
MGQTNQVGSDPVVTGFKVTDVYRDFRNVMEITARGLWAMVKYAKGACVSFTTRRVLEYAECGSLATPVVLTLVRHILLQLHVNGYLQVDESRSVRKYVVCKDSTLWHVAKNGDGPEDVFAFIEKEVE